MLFLRTYEELQGVSSQLTQIKTSEINMDLFKVHSRGLILTGNFLIQPLISSQASVLTYFQVMMARRIELLSLKFASIYYPSLCPSAPY